jgi:hypothetical protein
MNFTDIFFALFYGAAFFLVVYFIFMMFQRRPLNIQRASDPTVIVVEETPNYELPYWPWTYTPYNYWPNWFPWGYGGDGYYGRRWGPDHRVGWGRPHFGGGIHTRPYGGAGRGANVGGHHGGH